MTGSRFLSVVLAAVVLSAAAGHSSKECVYTLYVKTGSILKAGTDSRISASLSDPDGRSVRVADLESWGLMGSGHDYYERGNVDIFSGRGPCIGSPICRLNLTSDGAGKHHGWYCEFVDVTSTGPHQGCSQSIFHVEQWLATDAPPYDLTAVLDGCLRHRAPPEQGNAGRFVVRNRPNRVASASQ